MILTLNIEFVTFRGELKLRAYSDRALKGPSYFLMFEYGMTEDIFPSEEDSKTTTVQHKVEHSS